MRSVTLVCGPPCAGKSTLVQRHQAPGALVVDFDEIARAAGSRGKWQHSQAQGAVAERQVWALIERIALMDEGVAWVIRCAPEAGLREAIALRLRADRVVVLKPPLGTLFARAAARPRVAHTRAAIMRWLDRYSPSPIDELIR